jgi:hypothetical protein
MEVASNGPIAGPLANPAARVAPLTVAADSPGPAGVRPPRQRPGQQ